VGFREILIAVVGRRVAYGWMLTPRPPATLYEYEV
jgi:hypothetical protein